MLFDIKLGIHLVQGFLFFFGCLLIITGTYCSKLPGPDISGSSSSIVIGVFTCFVTFIAGIAAKLHQNSLTVITLILFSSLFGVQVVMAIQNLLTKNELVIRSYLKNMYLGRSKTEPNFLIREIQDYYKCCGYNGPNSEDVTYQDEIYISKGNEEPVLRNVTLIIPECCEEKILLCTKFDAYRKSCVEELIESNSNWSQIIGMFLIFSSLVLLSVIVLNVKLLAQY